MSVERLRGGMMFSVLVGIVGYAVGTIVMHRLTAREIENVRKQNDFLRLENYKLAKQLRKR